MNYLQIINKCLSELSFRQVDSFEELIKPEHHRVMNYINLISYEICNSDNWDFLLRRKVVSLSKGEREITNSINGRILAIYIDDKEYCYMEDFQKFMTKKTPEKFFSVFNDKLLFPEFMEDKLINIIYYTRDMAKSVDDIEKVRLEYADDKSLIPEPFIEQILVYGTCLRLKGDPQHVKYNYWLNMYTSALAMMRSKIAIDAGYAPMVRIVRR